VRLVVMLWAIWHARRKVIHENTFRSPLSTHSFIEHFVSNLETATTKLGKKGGVEALGALGAKPQWIPPELGFLKVNIDAALYKNSNVVAMAAVARDEARVFMGASTLVVNGIYDPKTAEVMACREGLALATDLLTWRVCIGTDYAAAVKSLAGSGIDRYNQ
jgi:hypothetical protein